MLGFKQFDIAAVILAGMSEGIVFVTVSLMFEAASKRPLHRQYGAPRSVINGGITNSVLFSPLINLHKYPLYSSETTFPKKRIPTRL